MICDNQYAIGSRPSAETRAELMRLNGMVRVYQKAILQTEDMRFAETLRKAIKVTQYDIHELEVA